MGSEGMLRDSSAPQTAQPRHFPAAFWVLLALAAVVRLPGITRPLLGNFATRNVVYAMIARNWANGNAGIWYPTLDLLGDGGRKVIMLEFPVSAYATARLWSTLGGSLDVWGRSVAAALSVASVAVMFLFVRRRHGHTAAAAAGLALAISPVSIIYGQSFMLEASLVFFTLATFYAFDRGLRGDGRAWLVAGCVCFGLLLLTKIYMLVVLLPLGWMLFRSDRAQQGFTRLGSAAALGAAIVPAACWYAHAFRTADPEGPYAGRIYYSVRQSAQEHQPPHPLLCSADFYRRVLDDLTGVVLTPVGFMLLLAGALDRRWREYAPWLSAMVLLVLLLPRKFYEMNYYYMAVLPPLCIVAGLGWQVIRQRLRPGRAAVAVVVLAAAVLSLRYAFRPAFVTPPEDRSVIEAARAVRELTDKDEPVVTIHGTTIDLLYYCDRPGWAIAPDTEELDAVLEGCRRRGARYVVVVGEGPLLESVVACGPDFRIHRLR